MSYGWPPTPIAGSLRQRLLGVDSGLACGRERSQKVGWTGKGPGGACTFALSKVSGGSACLLNREPRLQYQVHCSYPVVRRIGSPSDIVPPDPGNLLRPRAAPEEAPGKRTSAWSASIYSSSSKLGREGGVGKSLMVSHRQQLSLRRWRECPSDKGHRAPIILLLAWLARKRPTLGHHFSAIHGDSAQTKGTVLLSILSSSYRHRLQHLNHTFHFWSPATGMSTSRSQPGGNTQTHKTRCTSDAVHS